MKCRLLFIYRFRIELDTSIARKSLLRSDGSTFSICINTITILVSFLHRMRYFFPEYTAIVSRKSKVFVQLYSKTAEMTKSSEYFHDCIVLNYLYASTSICILAIFAFSYTSHQNIFFDCELARTHFPQNQRSAARFDA